MIIFQINILTNTSNHIINDRNHIQGKILTIRDGINKYDEITKTNTINSIINLIKGYINLLNKRDIQINQIIDNINKDLDITIYNLKNRKEMINETFTPQIIKLKK